MNHASSPGQEVAQAVQFWLEKEAGNSTFDRNQPLDNLEHGRQSLVERSDPKMNHHLDRMGLWLKEYDNPDLPSASAEMLSTRIAFGALMFLSGAYRRQRYLQAASQDDYYRRKLDWHHPGGIFIPDHMPAILSTLQNFDVREEDVARQGKNSMNTAEERLAIIYDRAPEDFGLEESASVNAVRQEQTSWLAFLAMSLTHASHSQDVPIIDVPILEPKSISDAEITTLRRVLPSHA